MSFLLAPENFTFAVAAALMLMIGVVEALGFGLAALDSSVDVDAGGAEPGSGAALLDWLGFGRLPLLMVVVVALGAFSLTGIGIQVVAANLTGGMLSAPFASVAAILGALPLTALLSRLLARILPADETTAVSLETLLGRRGHIVLGIASSGSPARARVRDPFGHSHYVLVAPNLPGETLSEGDEILLVSRDQEQFRAIAVAPHIHPQQGEAA